MVNLAAILLTDISVEVQLQGVEAKSIVREIFSKSMTHLLMDVSGLPVIDGVAGESVNHSAELVNIVLHEHLSRIKLLVSKYFIPVSNDTCKVFILRGLTILNERLNAFMNERTVL